MIRKIFGKYSLGVSILIVICCIYRDYKFIYSILGVILSLCTVTFLMMISKNLKLSNQLFKKRFFLFQPLFTLVGVWSYLSIKILTDESSKSTIELIAIITVIGLVIGLIWGYRDFIKIPKKYRNNKLVENLDKVDKYFDTENEGILILNDKNEVCFIEEEKVLLKFHKSDIQKVSVEVENKIFPISVSVELQDGKVHYFDSEFPYVWERELSN